MSHNNSHNFTIGHTVARDFNNGKLLHYSLDIIAIDSHKVNIHTSPLIF